METNVTITLGDCRRVMRSWPHRKIDLMFADPPFNIGHGYKGFNDHQEQEAFYGFMRDWFYIACHVALAPHATLCVHVPDELVYVVLDSARIAGIEQVDWLIWHYRFGQCNRGAFINSKCHCLVFAVGERPRTWNPEAVLVPSDRASKYNDPRTRATATPGQRVPLDVWDDAPNPVWGLPEDGPNWGRVHGKSAERRPGHPNQLPEVYVGRIIQAFSNPGDLVADPFVGSGTTAVVAAALGRHFIGCDIIEHNVESAWRRVREGSIRFRKEVEHAASA